MRCVFICDKPLTDDIKKRLPGLFEGILSGSVVDIFIAGNARFRADAMEICREIFDGLYYVRCRSVEYEETDDARCVVLRDAYMIKEEYLEQWRDAVLMENADYLILHTDRRTPAVAEWMARRSDSMYTII